jgi:hypothetical protein
MHRGKENEDGLREGVDDGLTLSPVRRRGSRRCLVPWPGLVAVGGCGGFTGGLTQDVTKQAAGRVYWPLSIFQYYVIIK